MVTALYKGNEMEAIEKFKSDMAEELVVAGVPAKLFGADLIQLLLQFAIEYFQGCLQIKSPDAIASDLRSPNGIQQFMFERRIARKVFRGNKNYRENKGKETVQALFNTCKQTPDDDLIAIVRYIDDNDVPEVNPDPIPIDLPSL